MPTYQDPFQNFRALLQTTPAAQGLLSSQAAPTFGQQAVQRPVPLWFGGKLPKGTGEGTAPWASPQQNSYYPQILQLLQNPLLLPQSPTVQPIPQLPIQQTQTPQPGQIPGLPPLQNPPSQQGALSQLPPQMQQMLQQAGILSPTANAAAPTAGSSGKGGPGAPANPPTGMPPELPLLPPIFAPSIGPNGQLIQNPVTPNMIPPPTPGAPSGTGTTLPPTGTLPLPAPTPPEGGWPAPPVPVPQPTKPPMPVPTYTPPTAVKPKQRPRAVPTTGRESKR